MNDVLGIGLAVCIALLGIGVLIVNLATPRALRSVPPRLVHDGRVHASGDRTPQRGGVSADRGPGSLVHGGELLAGGDRGVLSAAVDGPGSGDRGMAVDLGAGRAPLTPAEREALARKMSPRPRPSHRKVSMWSDARAALEHIKMVEFLLGFQPEKPRDLDWESVQVQLMDARAVLGQLCNALADEEIIP